MQGVTYDGCHLRAPYADCHYAECRYAECRGAASFVSLLQNVRLGRKKC